MALGNLGKFYKEQKKKNSDQRKEITAWNDGEEIKLLIGKPTIKDMERFNDVKDKGGLVKYFAEVLINYVFDPETGNKYFNIVDILAEIPGITNVNDFFNEYVDWGFIKTVQEEITAFMDGQERQDRIDDIKN